MVPGTRLPQPWLQDPWCLTSRVWSMMAALAIDTMSAFTSKEEAKS